MSYKTDAAFPHLREKDNSAAEIINVVTEAISKSSKKEMPPKAILNAVAAVAQKNRTKPPIVNALVCGVISCKDDRIAVESFV
ncbi:hypothetical protein SDC9_175338 [bioreactor metagenome]|uniref:Uncharacterized protein n=1 Tax=bioreactor metagenome TaxID=1076179 RepID=A0A645GV48_9ZZZZ